VLTGNVLVIVEDGWLQPLFSANDWLDFSACLARQRHGTRFDVPICVWMNRYKVRGGREYAIAVSSHYRHGNNAMQ
jgi:hypothetical protein